MKIEYVGIDKTGDYFHFKTVKLRNRYIFMTLFRLGFQIKLGNKQGISI